MSETLLSQPSFLKKNLLPGITVANLLVVAIMIFSLGLHLYNIDSIGDSNAYYTAAVESMTQSWHNFFFVAAEPGGSVTVDKPPLGLWIETVFAYFLGVSGFSTSLPNILAGVFGLPILYYLVKKYAGELAGLIAAFVMATTPVFLATNRNNTMDGILVFFLLLAAWAFIHATETGKLRWVLLGGFIVGLGFNIKMSQAFLPLPAFYALYFLGSKEGWIRKAVNLGIATVLMLAVSLSWAVAVDLVPADSRPYIGSSHDNSVISLIMEHNGGSRLVSGGGPGNAPRPDGQNQPPLGGTQNGQGFQPQDGLRQGTPPAAFDVCASASQGASCTFTLPNGNAINGTCIDAPNANGLVCAPQGMIPQNNQQGGQQPSRQGPPQQALDACANLSQGADCSFQGRDQTVNGICIMPPNLNELACAPQGMIPPNGQPPMGGPNGGGTPFSQETGEPGVLRFFTNPLSKQMSWLLPFALISIVLSVFGAKIQVPVESGVHKALILWGGWLLTCVVFFSMISGIFHSYYAIMLVPPLGAMVGLGFALLWSWSVDKPWVNALLIISVIIALAFQVFATFQYQERSLWMFGAAILFGLGIILVELQRRAAYVLLFSAMLVIPMYWTFMTVASSADQKLPTAYTGGNAGQGPNRMRMQNPPPASHVDQNLLAELQANTQDMKYLLAVPSSHQGAQIVLATGRPVLYMGGFGGQDDVVGVEDLKQMIAHGELRYILYGDGRNSRPEISAWLKSTCVNMVDFAQANNGPTPPNGLEGTLYLYRCQ
jgi:4-amino-4-deoxy-L-arabinose transferase-like glycosyltransferase